MRKQTTVFIEGTENSSQISFEQIKVVSNIRTRVKEKTWFLTTCKNTFAINGHQCQKCYRKNIFVTIFL